jgi:hypothetical protein
MTFADIACQNPDPEKKSDETKTGKLGYPT